MTSLVRSAHAKLNLFLRVLGPRDDGYHDVETVIVPISLHDVVTVEPAEELSVTVSGPTAAGVADGEANLALRAARAVAAEAGGAASRGARIAIEKRIPVAAGLGGGSADAAATILALDELWAVGLDRVALHRIALAVGSDVPALILGEPAFVGGRGDVVEPVLLQSTSWVLRTFGFGISSADAYGWWDERAATGPDPGALIAAAEAGDDALLGSAIYNDLQGPVVSRHPEIAAAIEALLSAGALGAVMSGSGPTVAALCPFGRARSIAEAVPGTIVVDTPPRARAPARIEGTDPSGVV